MVVNKDNRLLVEEELMNIKDLRQSAIEFLDNGGGKGDEACSYCRGIEIQNLLIIQKKPSFLLKMIDKPLTRRI